MSVHVIPVSVARRIEQLQRDSLWGDGGEGGHYHLVSWDRICRSKEQGGLGVRRWCGDWFLEFRFPLIFAIASNFEVLVSAVRVGEGQLRVNNDALVWDCPRAKGIFTVSSFYGALVADKCVVDGTFVYPWKNVWVSGTPSKVAFFVWTASLGRILTIDNLIRHGHILVNWCCLCSQAVESVDHFLIHCSVSSRLWMLVVAMFGLVWVRPGSLFAVLQSWVGGRVGKRRRKAWILALHCLLWLIWLERNKRVFHGVAHSITWLERRLLTVLYSWVIGLVDPDVLAFTDFVENLIS
ncbi:uncharacterized protein LOC114256937 [Camellia sinensis]|uniref:uncharacterized protein LOC114256937 n=1 Tax=Camellia sinensis TaxID=4442 RepID=UPI001035A394|nr:uncharacterized protein LOC114256937 [Camellia sinensis]